MSSHLRSPLTIVWILLTSVTFLSWWLGAIDRGGAPSLSMPVTAGVIAIAIVKARLVFWHFMEVRTGPAWLRWHCDGWLAVLALVLIGLYGFGP